MISGKRDSARLLRRASAAALESLESRMLMSTGSTGGSLDKLDANLVHVYTDYQNELKAGLIHSAAGLSTTNVVAHVSNGQVQLEAYASDGDGANLANLIQGLGGSYTQAYGRAVDAAVPVSALPQLAAISDLRFARASAYTTSVGAVNDQGDVAQRSSNARTNLGFDGTGTTVGVISDSYNEKGGAAANITSGDLPAAGVNVIQEDPFSGGTDEGRAMLQIVHDVAPGASLDFATAEGGQANFAANITALKNAGSKVIVDDVQYFAEPMFQDGPIAQAVDSAVAGGASYFTAATNMGNYGYASAWRTGNTYAPGQLQLDPNAYGGAVASPGGTSFDFDPGAGVDDTLSVTLPASHTFYISLQWDSPSFSVSGGAGSASDLDIYWMNPATGKILYDVTTNNVGGDSSEIMGINSGGAPLTENLMFLSKSGTLPSQIKFVTYNRDLTLNEYGYNAGTIFGHENAAGAEAVGAANYIQTPAFNISAPATLESFSSIGNTPILFDTAGNRLTTPITRDNPDITAPDGANTSGFSSTTGLNPFFGTSAASPHAAAIAALMLQANATLTPAQIYSALQSTALDMDNPYTPGFDVGYDNATGFGLVQADPAIISIMPSLASVPAGYWTGKGDGVNWNNAANWSQNTVPTSGTDVVVDLPSNPSITLSGAQNVHSVLSTESITVPTAGSLTVASNSFFTGFTLNGTLTANNAGVAMASTFNWNGGTIAGTGLSAIYVTTASVMNIGAGAHVSAIPLQVNGAVQTLSGGGDVIVFPSVVIAGTGFFNLADGTLIVDHSGSDQTNTIAAYISNGRNGGAWNGAGGINSSTAATTPNRTLGFGDATDIFGSFPATFAGQTIDNLAVLVRYTLPGDANLDRSVNVTDLGTLATNWQKSPRRFTQGDFSYNGTVDVTDLGQLATNWQTNIAASLPSLASVPPPTSPPTRGATRVVTDILG